MVSRTTKPQIPAAEPGIKQTIAARARARRKTQCALSEISAHALLGPRNDPAPKLRLETRAVDTLRPASRPVRRRDAKQSAKLDASVDAFGLCRPILIDADGAIIEGHGLYEVARVKGVLEVACIVIDHLNKTELRALGIALNRLGETGAWDPEALQLEFEELTVLGVDLVQTGFETAEIDAIMLLGDDEDLGSDETPAPRPSAATVSRIGDTWIAGDHRVAHGDARDPAVHSRLMLGDEQAQLGVTDPPWNVPNVGHTTTNKDHREFAFAHGEMSREEFAEFNRQWMVAVLEHLADGGQLLAFIDWRSVEILLACGRELGLALLNICVWVKTNGGQGSLWRSRHELCVCFKKGREPHTNNVELGRHGRWRSNVWEYAGASSLGSDSREALSVHPTSKPRVMIEDAILGVSNPGNIVVDCFGGSGSTLLAAEATGRRCRIIEYDAGYTDVIIRRWSEMTGRDAVLEETGETFAEVAERRGREGFSNPAPQSKHGHERVAPTFKGGLQTADGRGAAYREEARS